MQEKLDFTFLTIEQIFGDNQLKILKKYGTACAITDFSIFLGVDVAAGFYSSEGNSKKERAGYWWTKTNISDSNDIVNYVHFNGKKSSAFISNRDLGARPALSYSSISSKISSKFRRLNGILEVEYGEYPQTVVSEDFSKILEEAYLKKSMKQTGKSYTTDSVSYRDFDTPFRARTHTEYEYNGRKYIRCVADVNCGGEILSDGKFILYDNPYWVEVEPIKWMVDEKANIALSKKILFSGVQFNRRRDYKGDFSKSDIKIFMDNYFSKEILPMIKELTPEEKKKKEEKEKLLSRRQNSYNFNFDEVSEEEIIKGAIESGVAVFLHGKSSEGKSARVKQIDPECTIIYLRNATPESLNGKSVYNSETGEMIDIKPTWLRKLEDRCEKEKDKNHIVFFDEITNALPSIQGIAFNIVLDREVNGIWKLPENARVVAAGNEMKDSLAANMLAEPLFNRFAHVYIETTTESWLKWARENKIHPTIYAYIAYKNGETLRSEYNGEKPNADPRKWEMASNMLYKTGKPEMLRSLVGEEITREFCEFCKQKVITLEDVINDNYTKEEIEELNTAERYATALTLSQVDKENYQKVKMFVEKLGKEIVAIYDSLWIQDEEERMEIVIESDIENKVLVKK